MYTLFADPDAADTDIARRTSDNLGTPIMVQPPPSDQHDRRTAKKTIYLKNHKGSFLKACPCTSGHTCCGYKFLNIATNCPIDCTYCILQDYLGASPITIHCNIDDMLDELNETLGSSRRFFRIGTGELTDSLAIDEITEYTRQLVPFFAEHQNAILELKTKTSFVKNLIGLEHGGRTIVAWSLNPETLAASDEIGSTPVEDRIRAAKACQDEGYLVAFHFDPIIEHAGWREGYRRTVNMLFDAGIEQDKVAWISLGCLRFVPRMREIMAERFQDSLIRTGEFITGADGKARYFKPIRIELYSSLTEFIREGWPEAFIYLCMESRSVWNASLGWAPTSCELAAALDKRVM